MSYEPEQEMQDDAAAAGGEAGENPEGAGYDGTGEGETTDGGDDDLGGGEMAFVAEPKQPMNKGTLIVVGLLVACGAATYFMYVKSGPSAAIAAGDPNAEKVIGSFLDGSQKNVEQMRKMLQDTEKVVQQFKTQADQTQVPLAQLGGNPFMKEKPRPSEDTSAKQAAERVRLATERANEAVGLLRLQTIIHRDPRKASCMINNTLYRKNQQITVGEGKVTFTIAEIRPDGVSVTAPVGDQVLKFELKMKM